MQSVGGFHRFGDCVAWPLRVVLCRKTGGILRLFHYTVVKEGGVNVVIIERG